MCDSFQVWKRCMALARRCSTMRQLKAAQAVFTIHGLHRNTFAMSRLLLAFCALSNSNPVINLHYASLLFGSIEYPNCYIYNTLIGTYSRSSQPHMALHYFRLMLKDAGNSVVPDNRTFYFVLLACVNAFSFFLLGRKIHAWIVKNGVFASGSRVQTALIRLYAQWKVFGDARKLFDEITSPDVIKWNVLMNGYVRGGLGSDALIVFREMLACGIEPDEFCVATALTACAQLGALCQGKWIHEYIKKTKGLKPDVFVETALVDMYAKCGSIDMAADVFERMRERNVFSWSAMVRGFAAHGFAKKAFHCLERMQVEDGFRPDGVVLLGVLTACTHAGLLKEGQFLLDNMEEQYGIVPKHEHYSCVVDLLCRAGQLDNAIQLIRRMPMKPLASVWGALLSSCRTHKNVEIAELAVEELLKLEKGNREEEDAALVQLSNVYLDARRSEDACKVRRMIGDAGLRKTPGCSMVELDGRANEFVSGDVSHPNCTQIYAMLELLSIHPLYN